MADQVPDPAVASGEAERRLQAALASLESGPHSVVEFSLSPTGGLKYWLVLDAAEVEGFHMTPARTQDGGLSSRARGFPASSVRPPELAEDLPFLANCGCIVNPSQSAVRVYWLSPKQPLEGFRELVEFHINDGWVHRSSGPVPLASREPRYAEFRKADRVRVLCFRIFGGAGDLSLVEEPA